MPGPAFFLLTYPIALISLACVGAYVHAKVNLLELSAMWHTFRGVEFPRSLLATVFHCIRCNDSGLLGCGPIH
jgi:hypothetical protein